ncbi:aromatic-L-amino-acid decarboxylase-like [Acanthaster planci]|uniref:Aromatic-L-amino-acid decarboxylase n=1 Tax=Acanthaster planci TaxID=133434 RepID=A0A8B7ZXL3_ACAPL|nr:aromatic-L-amino-acid decarboxylase-like [Acanthaster planci]XP_022109836.1 aromatic-L-amino-acid decarboxylase-like [Acanthaster planci]XP_022109837.1 aromatic-L-amino-acid decarboxylase-like [Acanthaster planci]XP_022109838.1 aromatic-L-amino-acid decarboxylase-like [Acanthaster planci]
MTNSADFRQWGKEMVDYIADYLDNIADRPPLSQVEPGYLRKLIPEEAPHYPDKWQDVFADIERIIMPGVTHWHSPHFHSYFPTGNSYAAILGDMLSDAIGCIGFSWISSPACTELEMVTLDWLGKMLRLPDSFLSCTEGGQGGGVIQGTASESTVMALLSAKMRSIRQYKALQPERDQYEIMSKLVAYTSEYAHSSVERASLISSVKMRMLPCDDKYALRGETLAKAIQEDKAEGLIPAFVCATIGTTPSCAFDNLEEIGPICEAEKVWLHVDAAYAGTALICPEFRSLANGIELADSFNFNPHKWMRVNFDCSAMWVRNQTDLVGAFQVDPTYLKHEHEGKVVDYRHWHIPLGRRFRSLKLWFVLRLFGVSQLQEHIRKQVNLAHEFEALVRKDARFEIVADVVLGLVCFRLKGTDVENEELLRRVTKTGKVFLVGSHLNKQFVIRFAVCAPQTTSEDIHYAWNAITEETNSPLLNGITNVSNGK